MSDQSEIEIAVHDKKEDEKQYDYHGQHEPQILHLLIPDEKHNQSYHQQWEQQDIIRMIEHLLERCYEYAGLTDIGKERIQELRIYLSASGIEDGSYRIEAEDDLIDDITEHDR